MFAFPTPAADTRHMDQGRESCHAAPSRLPVAAEVAMTLASDEAARRLLQQQQPQQQQPQQPQPPQPQQQQPQVSFLDTGLSFSSPLSTAALSRRGPSSARPLPDTSQTAVHPPPSAAGSAAPPPPPETPAAAVAGSCSGDGGGSGSGLPFETDPATLELLEARAQGAASLAALSAHAAQLETQLRAQANACARAEAARAEAVAAQASLEREVSTLTQEKQRITEQLDHYMGRSDELIAERGAGAQQLSDLARTIAQERESHKAQAAELQARLAASQAEAAESQAARKALEQQNLALHADLSEVTRLIDQLEGEPAYVRARLYKRGSPLKREKELQMRQEKELRTRAEGLEVEVHALRDALQTADLELATVGGSQGGGGGLLLSPEEGALLREENRILESQLELLSEKMYGSPAKSAAKERDRLQIELEKERAERMRLEEAINVLHEELERAHCRVAELMAQRHVEEHTRQDLERTRRALRAAQTNAALGLMAGAPPPARAYNPIAAPRHQFGGGGGASFSGGGGGGSHARASTPTGTFRGSSSARGPSPGRASFGPGSRGVITPKTAAVTMPHHGSTRGQAY